MSPASSQESSQRRRQRLLQAGLLEKVTWVPAALADRLMHFARELRHQASIPLREDAKVSGVALHPNPVEATGKARLTQKAAAPQRR